MRERGSSPLARGLLEPRPVNLGGARIIPARAGFTPASPASPADHPRSRGVYVVGWLPKLGTRGSSPLARGLLEPRPVDLGGARIIPARAGFTVERGMSVALLRDHPRSRGVYSAQTLT